jgi:hypothetical protein
MCHLRVSDTHVNPEPDYPPFSYTHLTFIRFLELVIDWLQKC